MGRRIGWTSLIFLGLFLVAGGTLVPVAAAPLHGSMFIDGYDLKKDKAPEGTIKFDKAANEFYGSYERLKLPPGKNELEVWLYDTDGRKATSLGRIGYSGTDGSFRIANLAEFSEGLEFGPYEVIAFSAETKEVAVDQPSGSKMQKVLKPAFYLFSALPNSTADNFFCGHGRDWTYTNDFTHMCFDCFCGQQYKVCRAAGEKLLKGG